MFRSAVFLCAALLLVVVVAVNAVPCTKCGLDCAHMGANFCSDASDGCTTCRASNDPYNPGTRCLQPLSKQPAFNATLGDTCNLCYISCTAGGAAACSQAAGPGACKQCYDTGYGYKFCIPGSEQARKDALDTVQDNVYLVSNKISREVQAILYAIMDGRVEPQSQQISLLETAIRKTFQVEFEKRMQQQQHGR